MTRSLLLLLSFLSVMSVTPSLQAQLTGRNPLSSLEIPQPLAQEEAFAFFVSVATAGQLQITWQLAPGHYLYRHRFGFFLEQIPEGPRENLAYTLPEGLQKHDQFFGDTEVYYDQVVATLLLPTPTQVTARLVIQYQGCADWGYCYPPRTVIYPLSP